MTAVHRTATDYAHSIVASGDPLDQRALEAAQFASRPEPAAALAAATEALDREPPRHDLALGVLEVVVDFLPVLIPGVLFVAGTFDGPVPAGALIAVAALSLVVAVRRVLQWRRADWHGSPREGVLAAVGAGFGALTVVLTALTVPTTPVSGALAAIAAALMTIAEVVAFVVIRRRSAAAPTPPTAADALRASLAALSDRDRADLAADLERATGILAEHGVIDEAERSDLLAAPLGGLARRAWALEVQARRAALG
ncbi:hypothetical protein [Agromyces seonyuensis]|uniref:Uncharacterized protein n=1 Tax=Agromyces seonyuensis TaxID=2662446 RepID=A0A6I4P4H5_9MICO|nr:hypothetical protein [Agromyces seonyuensis]MWB98204.1 hypothetical protein [Agromyces seonyuensis]